MLKPRNQWTKAKTQDELTEAMEEVVRRIPGQNYEFSQPVELRMNELVSGVRSDVAVKVYGDEMDIMRQYADLVEDELKGIPGAQDIKVEQVAGLPMVTIEVDRLAVARYGLNVKDVQEVIEISLAGANAGQVVQGDRRFELVVRLPENLRGNLLSLGSLPIPLPRAEGPPAHAAALSDGDKPSAGYVPLSSVAAIGIADGARQIRREDGKRRIV